MIPKAYANQTALLNERTALTYPHPLRALLLYRVKTMLQNVNKRVKSMRRRHMKYHNRKVHIEPRPFGVGQHVYINCPPLESFAAERLATDS